MKLLIHCHISNCIRHLLPPQTLKTISAVPAQMMNICGKFHWNLSTNQRDIASCETGINGQTTEDRIAASPPQPIVGGGISRSAGSIISFPASSDDKGGDKNAHVISLIM